MSPQTIYSFCEEAIELLNDPSLTPQEKLYELKTLAKAYSLHTTNINLIFPEIGDRDTINEFLCFVRFLFSDFLPRVPTKTIILQIKNLLISISNKRVPHSSFCQTIRHYSNQFIELSIHTSLPSRIEGSPTYQPSQKIVVIPDRFLNIYDFPYPLPTNTTVRFFNLHRSNDNTLIFTSNSTAVLSPDFLIDTTMILYNPYRSLIDALLPTTISVPLLRGSIVNELIDSLILNPQDTRLALRRAVLKYPLSLCVLYHIDQSAVSPLIKELLQHLPHIKKFVTARLSEGTVLTEMNIISPLLGFQGRIDCYQETQKGITLYEFKSGKERPADHQQVGLYQTLHQLNEKNLLYSTIFYSQTGTTKSTTAEINLKRLLNNRNKLVYLLILLARHRFKQFVDEIKHFRQRISYEDESIEIFLKAIDNAGSIQRAYYFELLSFLIREYFFVKRDVQAPLWKSSRDEKEHSSAIIGNMHFVSHSPESNTLTFAYDGHPHFFREGDPVLLYPDTKKESPHKHLLFSCVIRKILPDQIVISPFNRQRDIVETIKKHDRWAIETNLIDKQFWDSMRALFNILSSKTSTLKVILREIDNPKSNDNSSSLEPVEKALQSSEFFLLQGPPGSGKTSTFLINYVKQVLQQNNVLHVFILAFTNKAVQNICLKLQANNIPYIRFGSKYTNDPAFFNKLAHDGYVNAQNIIEEVMHNISRWYKQLTNTRVIVSTIASFKSHLTEFARLFDLSNSELIIDEASQVTEADIAGIIPLFRKFVLIGDHKQLPPVIAQPEHLLNVKNPDLRKMGFISLRISLFERLITHCISNNLTTNYDQLQNHYRTHKDIADLYRKHYTKPLIERLPHQKTTSPPFKLPPPFHAIHKRAIFIPHSSKETGKRNLKEVDIVSNVVKLLTASGIKSRQIGIVTPFRQQINALRNVLPYQDLIIDTVERFQGDERDIIIYSASVNNINWLNRIRTINYAPPRETDTRLLVAISRAKHLFIMTGNPDILLKDQHYEDVISQCQLLVMP